MSIFFEHRFKTDPSCKRSAKWRDEVLISTDVGVELHIWSDVEGCTTVIAACLPSLYPLFKRAKPMRLSQKVTSITRRLLSGGSRNLSKPDSETKESQSSNERHEQRTEKPAMAPWAISTKATGPGREDFWVDLEHDAIPLNRIAISHDLRISEEMPKELIQGEKEAMPTELMQGQKKGFF